MIADDAERSIAAAIRAGNKTLPARKRFDAGFPLNLEPSAVAPRKHRGSTGAEFRRVTRGNGAPLAPLFLACVTARSAVARKALRRAARIWNCPAGSALVRSGASVVLPWCNSAQLPQPARTPKYLMD
jgi:hypothetical protein